MQFQKPIFLKSDNKNHHPLLWKLSLRLLKFNNCSENNAFTNVRLSVLKFFPLINEKFDSCKLMLKDNKIQFHSCNSKENRMYTNFLYGLPRISTEDIITGLKSYNLIPSAVIEIKTKFSSNNNAVYKVQFTRKTFNPNALNNCK